MPIVPSNRQLISTDVPSAPDQTQGAGLLGSAVAGVGQAAFDSGFALLNKAKQVEAQDQASNELLSNKLQTEKLYVGLKLRSKDGNAYDETGNPIKNPDGTFKTLASEFHDQANQLYETSQSKMGSFLAQTIYKENAAPFFTGQVSKMQADQLQTQVESAKNNIVNRTQIMSSDLVSTPSIQKMYDYSNTSNLNIQGGIGKLWDANTAEESKRKHNQQLAESLFKGLYDNALVGSDDPSMTGVRVAKIDMALAMLDGKDSASFIRQAHGLPTADQMISPDQKASMIKEFIKLRQDAGTADRNDFYVWYENTLDAAKAGSITTLQSNVILSKISALPSSSATDAEKRNYIAGFQGALETGRLNATGFALQPTHIQDDIINEKARSTYGAGQNPDGSDVIGKSASTAFIQHAELEQQRANKAAQDDFPALAQSSSGSSAGQLFQRVQVNAQNLPSLETKAGAYHDYMRELKRAYNHKYPETDLYWRGGGLDKATTQEIASKLDDPNNSPENVALSIRGIQKMAGPTKGDRNNYYPELIKQMVDDKVLGEEWRVLGAFPAERKTLEATAMVVGAIRGKWDKAWEQTIGVSGDIRKNFDTNLALQTRPWVESYLAASPRSANRSEQVVAIQKVIGSLAKQMQLNDSNLQDSTAVERAWGFLVKDHMTSISGGSRFMGLANAWTKQYYPAEINGVPLDDNAKQRISGAITSTQSLDGFKKAGVIVPAPYNQSPDMRDSWLTQRAKEAVPKADPSGANFTFWYPIRNANGEVRGESQIFIPNPKGGKPIPLTIDAGSLALPLMVPRPKGAVEPQAPPPKKTPKPDMNNVTRDSRPGLGP